jgi:phage baseplate assembly protein gpV
MAILKEEIIGSKIINEIQSSNVVKTEYDTTTKKLIVEFKNGTKYEYDDVPHQLHVQFRMSESQGKFFSSKIAKEYKYKKL